MEKNMDWYYCSNSDGSCEGYVNEGNTPGEYVCNCGGPHDWIFKGTYLTDTNKYPKGSFYIR